VALQISQSFAQVETFIKQQVYNMNNRYRLENSEAYEKDGDFWTPRDTNDFLVAAYAMIANEITTNKKWPWALPDPNKLAENAHKKIQNQLLHVRFRDNNKLMSSLLIDHNNKGRSWKSYYKAGMAEDAQSDEKNDDPEPASAADVEKGTGVCC